MLPGTLVKGFDKRRLRNLLLLFFLALALPTVVLIRQAYSQLKWEAFHQYRGQAEELTARIDARLIDMINIADARSFADYSFLVVTGDPAANFLQRSVLATYPVPRDIPGLLGYFQVDVSGTFSTPILPTEGSDRRKLGIDAGEFVNRQLLAQEIQKVLADNRLVRSRPERRLPVAPTDIVAAREAIAEEEKDVLAEVRVQSSAQQPGMAAADFADSSQIGKVDSNAYTQQVFDRLGAREKDKSAKPSKAGAPDFDESPREDDTAQPAPATVGKVSDIKLESAYQKKIEQLEKAVSDETAANGSRFNAPARSRSPRKEQSTLPASDVPSDDMHSVVTQSPDVRISTFESEIDPLEFSLLDSGHFVLFRKVWRDGERHIQGLVLDQAAFVEDVIVGSFMDTSLALMSNLIVAYQDNVIVDARGRMNSYPNGNQSLDGSLLYRSRLSTPLDSLELIFSVTRLPAGPGASVLGWVTIILTIVFVVGFITLYRLGASQISLARQQQDFVSAVSHELKTPLTSIRMYGEMLKEGWADEDKRQSYYEFIHDESERLTRLISNVLQLARITRNEPQFDMRPINAGELMNQIESKIANQVEHAGFELHFAGDDKASRASVNVDSDCFVQIIINLVDNAIKFSKDAEMKRIEIASTYSNNKVRFKVRDFGPGIPKNQLKKIFRLFYRSESELTRETVGTGIGLAIVHQLTLAMNGTVDVINCSPGVEFTVSFSAL